MSILRRPGRIIGFFKGSSMLRSRLARKEWAVDMGGVVREKRVNMEETCVFKGGL